jgi:hypothetical protein
LGTARLIERISQTELSKVERLRFTPQALSESRELLPKFISYQLGKELKSLKAINEIEGQFKFEARAEHPAGINPNFETSTNFKNTIDPNK